MIPVTNLALFDLVFALYFLNILFWNFQQLRFLQFFRFTVKPVSSGHSQSVSVKPASSGHSQSVSVKPVSSGHSQSVSV